MQYPVTVEDDVPELELSELVVLPGLVTLPESDEVPGTEPVLALAPDPLCLVRLRVLPSVVGEY